MILFIIASIVIVVAIPTTRENGVMAFSCRPPPSLAALPLFNTTIMIDHDPVHHRQHRRLKPKFFEVAGRREYMRTLR